MKRMSTRSPWDPLGGISSGIEPEHAPAYAPRIAVVIPSYRVRSTILPVLELVGPEVGAIFVVDDACPEGTGDFVRTSCADARVSVLRHERNQGVGGAVVTGYTAALDWGADVIVKIDGDGQMDPAFVPTLIQPLLLGDADYVKGNRFYSLESLRAMPLVRLIGNSVLSFLSKASSGYWNIMDPTNGFTAVHAGVLNLIALHKLDKRYFFESDMLFRLNIVRAVVKDVRMDARYEGEASNLSVLGTIRDFPGKYLRRFLKRIAYSYFVRDFNPCSINLIVGCLALLFGGTFGAWHWYLSIRYQMPATTGTVMVAALPVILGAQLILSAINYDLSNVPKEPLQRALPRNARASG